MVTTGVPDPVPNAPAYWVDACRHLMKRDRVLKKLIPQYGSACLQSRGDAFGTLARSIVAQGLDRAMTPQERLFVYLPFEHSENADDQSWSVRLVRELGNESWTRYALAHQVAIDRFGRFPFRNAALGRISTADELAYMSESARS